MILATHNDLIPNWPPHEALDWARLVSALIGAYFLGMAVWVTRLYRNRRPRYHIRLIALGNVVYVTTMVMAELALVDAPSRGAISWLIVSGLSLGGLLMIFALHGLLGRQEPE